MRLPIASPALLSLALSLLLALGISPSAAPLAAPPLDSIITLSPTGAGRAHALAYSPDGLLLAVGTDSGLVIYDARQYSELRFIPSPVWVRSVAFSPDGQTLAAGYYDTTVRLWRVSDGALLHELTDHGSWVRSVAFSPDGAVLITACDDGALRWWRPGDGTLLRTVSDSLTGLRVVAFSPDGRLLAAGAGDNQIHLLNVVDGTLVRRLAGHSAWIRALAFSPDGQTLASGAFDATARLWRVSDGASLLTLTDHAFSVLSVAFSPDGQTLATGSVDKTTRLWRVSDGAPLRILIGHDNFVFGVAYAPDGHLLATAAADNTIRLWTVEPGAPASPTEPLEAPPSVDASCVTCHHPRGDLSRPNGVTSPPPVVDVACGACHWEGSLGLNWCPAFPRSAGDNTLYGTIEDLAYQVGVQRATRALSVGLSAPGNGEHLYVPSHHTALPISGRVFAAAGQPADLEVRLEIWSGGVQTAAATTQAEVDGRFYFITDLRPDGIVLEVPIEERGCVMCHDETLAENPFLPPGDVRLVVTAVGADGQVASDERWITVDRSQSASLTVQAVLEGGAALPAADLLVQAQTRLYDWRGRSFAGMTDAGGAAALQVEALSEVPTHYSISVPPSIVDGVRYESLAPVELTLPAGAVEAAPLTLVVRAQRGAITGRLSGAAADLTGIPIWAVDPTSGVNVQTLAGQDGAFAFADLPIQPYLIVAEAAALAEHGLTSPALALDLTITPQAEATLALAPLEGLTLRGVARNSAGRPLPFAWAAVDGNRLASTVGPATGGWTMWEAPAPGRAVIVSAPGYFSQAQAISGAADQTGALSFDLIERPGTRHLPWGSGEVILPAESLAVLEGHTLALERGWSWGQSASPAPLTLETAGVAITISSGRFALENVLGQTAWLYVLEGEAGARKLDDTGPITVVPANSMLALDPEHLHPAPLDEAILAALRPATAMPISAVWEPSPAARARNWLARMGINTAQIITFVTYSAVLVALFSLPVLGVIWWKRKARSDSKKAP